MSARRWSMALAAVAASLTVGTAPAAERTPAREARDLAAFSTLKAAAPEAAREQALAWLKSVKPDAAALQKFDAVWKQTDRPVLDRVTDTLKLGDADAAKLLAKAADPNSAAPLESPAHIRDAKRPVFYRANLALAYARALSQRRIYEEALDSLRAARAEQVVDPASFLFHKAVAEHALLLKDDATRTIARLLDDVADAPERYRHLATLMHFEMLGWKDKDLDWIARKMDNIERRLDLARGGPKTQKMQKEVVARLDELIKKLENECKGSSQCNGGACPGGGSGNNPGNTNQPSSPQRDSVGGNNGGPGQVERKYLDGLAKAWGKLPEKERAAAMENLKRDLPPRYREAIESYFKKMAQGGPAR